MTPNLKGIILLKRRKMNCYRGSRHQCLHLLVYHLLLIMTLPQKPFVAGNVSTPSAILETSTLEHTSADDPMSDSDKAIVDGFIVSL